MWAIRWRDGALRALGAHTTSPDHKSAAIRTNRPRRPLIPGTTGTGSQTGAIKPKTAKRLRPHVHLRERTRERPWTRTSSTRTLRISKYFSETPQSCGACKGPRPRSALTRRRREEGQDGNAANDNTYCRAKLYRIGQPEDKPCKLNGARTSGHKGFLHHRPSKNLFNTHIVASQIDLGYPNSIPLWAPTGLYKDVMNP